MLSVKLFKTLFWGVLCLLAGKASATWSILLADLETGEIAVGSATCLTGFDLRENTPVLIPGIGAATAQSFVDSRGLNRTLIRDLLAEGVSSDEILLELAMFDSGHQTRQYGMLSTRGDAVTFSGTGAGAWAGGVTGILPGAGVTGGDILYAIQGNVLTGPSVVNESLAAIAGSTGDLSEMLMLAMEAARAQGGDGRCSCAGGDPTGCGDPPASFNKSSHIAYMLVARAGDTERCAPTIDMGAFEAFDVGQGAPGQSRVVLWDAMDDSARVHDLLSDVSPGRLDRDPFEIAPGGAGIAGLSDLNGDGWSDLVTTAKGESFVRFANPDTGTFDGGVLVENAGAVIGEKNAIGDFDGDGRLDVVRPGSLSQYLILYGDENGGFSISRAYTLPADAEDSLAADMDGDTQVELVMLLADASAVHVIEIGADRNASTSEIIDLGADRPIEFVAFSPNADGRPDLFVSTDAPGVIHVIRKPGQAPALAPFATNGTVRSLAVGDVNADGFDDVVAATSFISKLYESFSFVPDVLIESELLLAGGADQVALANLSGNSGADLLYRANSWDALRMIPNTGTGFGATRGCANGTYYMNFNVADTQLSDPDPVFTLRDMYDQWRTDLVGVTDAVRSGASLDGDLLDPALGCERILTITPRDWASGVISGVRAADVIVQHAEGSDAAGVIGAVTDLGHGSFEVLISGAGVTGLDVYAVSIIDPSSGEEVRLMPEIELLVDDLADMDNDGDRDEDDFTLWLTAFQNDDPGADQNRNGRVEPTDFNAWIRNYRLVCGG